MFLEKLEINGFKSFAHKAVLTFKPGITAVVGPNGSGKSNVADAFRWVLGEQSLKLLRGKKSEDVIFSGSDKKARLGMAEVSLYFNNENDEAGIGMSEICLTRRLYRSGESEYLINKQKARLLDIQLLLAKTGVAHTSYSIIGQGMVDAFLLASNEERKEFFEEASGVKPLQIKRSQTLNKLEQTEANLNLATVQLNEISPRLNSLTRQVKKLEHRAELEKELKAQQTAYYTEIWQDIENNYQVQHANLVTLTSEQEKARAVVVNLQNELAKLTRDSAKSEKLEKLQTDYQKTLEHKMSLSEQLSELRIKQIQQVQKTVKHKDVPYLTAQEIIKLMRTVVEVGAVIEDNWLAKDWTTLEVNFKKQQDLIQKVNELLQPFKENGTEKTTVNQNNDGAEKIKVLEKEIILTEDKVKAIQEIMRQESEKERDERSQIWEIQQQYQKQQESLNQISNQVNNLRIENARLETHRDDLKQEILTELGSLENLTQTRVEKLSATAKQNLTGDISRLKHQLELIGGIDPEVQTEYLAIQSRYDFLSTQTTDLSQSLISLEKLILELNEVVRQQFETSFKIIDEEFQKYFKILFAGGKAKLVLVRADTDQTSADKPSDQTGDAESLVALEKEINMVETKKIRDRLTNNFYSGVEIEATPPGKKLKNIGMLSGGERAMASIALICAIISAHPSPFVILDEVDAALDEANSMRFADIVEDLSTRSQFIVITHNRATMEKAEVLYGVTMGAEGVSALLSLKLEGAEKYTNR